MDTEIRQGVRALLSGGTSVLSTDEIETLLVGLRQEQEARKLPVKKAAMWTVIIRYESFRFQLHFTFLPTPDEVLQALASDENTPAVDFAVGLPLPEPLREQCLSGRYQIRTDVYLFDRG
jgi:hypothetical protein